MPETKIAVMVTGPSPVLAKVKFCPAEVAPTTVVAKVPVAGVRVAASLGAGNAKKPSSWMVQVREKADAEEMAKVLMEQRPEQ